VTFGPVLINLEAFIVGKVNASLKSPMLNKDLIKASTETNSLKSPMLSQLLIRLIIIFT